MVSADDEGTGGGEAATVSVIPIPTWTCPHCGYVHKAVELVRIDQDKVACKGCGKAFDAVADYGYRKGEEGEQKMQR